MLSSQPSWFEDLFGFEESQADVKAKLTSEPGVLKSLANGRSFTVGNFSTPSLAELRTQHALLWPDTSDDTRLRLSHVSTSDVFALHALPKNRLATFQVASQLNCLEFASSDVVPEDGVSGYTHDRTQGPACALAAAPATVFRNYFVNMGNGQLGQTAGSQINNLAKLLRALDAEGLVEVRNGYAESDDSRLAALNKRISASERDSWLSQLQVGLHSGVEVPFSRREGGQYHLAQQPSCVSQVFCSAIPVSFGASDEWTAFASAVLEGTYEATLLAASAELASGAGSGKVFLTFIGGGVFGNPETWIEAAIVKACKRLAHVPLEVILVHHGGINELIGLRIGEAMESDGPLGPQPSLEEQRIDPEDGVARTFEELVVERAGQYTGRELRDYWDTMSVVQLEPLELAEERVISMKALHDAQEKLALGKYVPKFLRDAVHAGATGTSVPETSGSSCP